MNNDSLSAFLSTPLKLSAGFTFPSRAIMSPMEGLMNSPLFFQTAKTLSLIDFWMPPFQGISPHAVPSPASLRKKYKIYLQEGFPFFLQYLGHDPESAAEGTFHAAEAGIKGVNFNFACPSKTVLKSHSGGALLQNPRLMQKMILAAKKKVPQMCISIKIRTGFQRMEECKEIFEILKDSGVDLVICHARTVEEKYSFLSGDEISKRMCLAVESAGSIPLFGNGDIVNDETAARYRECGCCGIAAARGLLKDPWLLRRLKGESCCDAEEGKKLFLTTFQNSLRGRQGRGTLAECIKIAYGEDSQEFRNYLQTVQKQGQKKDKA